MGDGGGMAASCAKYLQKRIKNVIGHNETFQELKMLQRLLRCSRAHPNGLIRCWLGGREGKDEMPSTVGKGGELHELK
jgi:hypothetical protein